MVRLFYIYSEPDRSFYARLKNGRNSSPVADCDSRNDASRVCLLSDREYKFISSIPQVQESKWISMAGVALLPV